MQKGLILNGTDMRSRAFKHLSLKFKWFLKSRFCVFVHRRELRCMKYSSRVARVILENPSDRTKVHLIYANVTYEDFLLRQIMIFIDITSQSHLHQLEESVTEDMEWNTG